MSDAWQNALEVQLDLHAWWRTPLGKRFGDTFGASIANQYEQAERADAAAEGRNEDDAVLLARIYDNLDAARLISEHETRALGSGETYYVETEMAAFCAGAAHSLGDSINLKPEDLPHPSGFIFIECGVPMTDVNGDTLVVHLVTWHTDAFEDPTVRAVDYALYSDLADERETSHDALAYRASDGKYGLPRYALFHVGSLLYGERCWPNPADVPWRLTLGQVLVPGSATKETVVAAAHSTVDIEKWIAAFWLLIDEPIIEAVQRHPRRHLGRRAARAFDCPDETTVRFVRLRRLSDIDERTLDYEYDADASAARFSHRWYVTPHWRRLKSGKVVRVRGHIKGPSTAPLIIRDHVYVWER